MELKIKMLLLATLMMVSCSQDDGITTNHDVGFVKSAHYFSSAWPKTFWQEFEEPDVVPELKQIKTDGFNTIVLTVPWRGFEVGFENSKTQSNPELYQRLEFLLQSIVDQDLYFMLRVGFPHDYTANTGTDGMAQCIGIYSEEKMQNHWLNYLEKIKKVTNPFIDSSAGILVSWEDFWCPHFVFPHMNDEKRLKMAQAMNYGEWLQQRNSNITKVLLQQSEPNFDQIKIPKPADLSYVLYLEFIDHMLDSKVLKPTQSVFENAALEIRVDKLPIKQGDQYTWVGHDLYLEETNHRGTYWAPFWGAKNESELLTAEQALNNFKYFLKVVTDQGKNTNHVIEQFNFFDNTPYFPKNANIKSDEIDDFLIGAAPLLEDFTQGFGVWAYRDYQDNGLHNSSFEMGVDGWQTQGLLEIINSDEDQRLLMAAGASIEQSFIASDRFMLASAYEQLELCLIADNNGQLTINLNQDDSIAWNLLAGKNCTSIPAEPFKSNNATTIKFTAKTKVQIDELSLHGFTQKLGLYDTEGKPAMNLEAYKKLNGLVE